MLVSEPIWLNGNLVYPTYLSPVFEFGDTELFFTSLTTAYICFSLLHPCTFHTTFGYPFGGENNVLSES